LQRRASSVKSGRGFLLNDNTALAARKMQRRGTTDIEREPGLQKTPPKGGAEINVFVKPSAEPNLFRLCRGEKTTVENKRTEFPIRDWD